MPAYDYPDREEVSASEAKLLATQVLHGPQATDPDGYNWLAGNLITTASQTKQKAEADVSPEERDLARKIYRRLVAELSGAGHEQIYSAGYSGYLLQLQKDERGISLSMSYEGAISNQENEINRSQRACKHVNALLKEAAASERVQVRGDGTLLFKNLTDLAQVVNAIALDEHKIELPPASAAKNT